MEVTRRAARPRCLGAGRGGSGCGRPNALIGTRGGVGGGALGLHPCGGRGGRLASGVVEPAGSGLPPVAAQPSPGVLAGVVDARVQPEPAGARGPQLLPVALRHPGHPDLRRLEPPGLRSLPCSAAEAVPSSPDRCRQEPIRPSLPIPIGFIMAARRLGRVSCPCRSRYATSAARSPSSDRRRRPVAVPPDGRARPSGPPRRCLPGRVGPPGSAPR